MYSTILSHALSAWQEVKLRYQAWIRDEAPHDLRLRKSLRARDSEYPAVRWGAHLRLIIGFVLVKLRTYGSQHKDSAQLAREVLAELNGLPPHEPTMLSLTGNAAPSHEVGAQVPASPVSEAVVEVNAPAELRVRTEERTATDAGAPVNAAPATQAAESGTPKQIAILEVFLQQMMTATENETRQIEEDTNRLRARESVLFLLMTIAGVVTFGFVVAGIVLIFRERIAAGLAAEALALFPGAGTAILRHLSRRTVSDRRGLARTRDSNLKILRAIQTVFLIDDPVERNRQVGELAQALSRAALA